MNGIAYLSGKATRQEHLGELEDWMTAQVNIWTREYKQQRHPNDKMKLEFYEAALGLLKGYVESFTKEVPTDIKEPKIERERLGDIDTRYNHLVTLLEMWRDTAEFIKDHHVGKIIPTSDLNKIRMFEKTVEIVEIYQENLTGQFEYPGVAKIYPSFKEGAGRLLKPTCDEMGRLGIAANKKRLLDAANEKIASEKAAQEDAPLEKGQVPSKNEEDFGRVPHTKTNPSGGEDPEDDTGYAVT